MTHKETLQKAVANNDLSELAKDNIWAWLTKSKYAEYKNQLEQVITDKKWTELNDCFFQVVPFGTGGRRGTVGIGPNRINRITIGESAQGLADYLQHLDTATKERGVVIAHDTRLTSEEFTKIAASVFIANGFTTYVFDSHRPTPELSFAVRHLKAAAGVVVSASHNPPQDNGFKVYWSDGGQLVSPHAEKLTNFVARVTDIHINHDKTPKIIAGDVDQAYIQAILKESLNPSRSATLVYSPLHGTGMRSVLPTLKEAGFSVKLVEEQTSPDGSFPSVAKNSPNPENIPANDQAATLAQKQNADIAITTDPDADRLGVVARDDSGQYQFLTGNHIAALLGWFVADQMKQQKTLLPNHFFVKTIVTTDFLNAIAADFGIKMYDDLLIGFKYVAEMIRNYQDNGSEIFLFGGEESHGILKGSYTRDKDAAIAALLMAELTSVLKDQGHTLIWQLDQLYKKYGIFVEALSSTYYEGASGFAQMQNIMKKIREHPPTQLGNLPVVNIVDRATGQHGTKGDVMILHLSVDTHTRLTIRPSGTEPKLKIYTQLHQPVSTEISESDLQTAKQTATTQADLLTKEISEYLTS